MGRIQEKFQEMIAEIQKKNEEKILKRRIRNFNTQTKEFFKKELSAFWNNKRENWNKSNAVDEVCVDSEIRFWIGYLNSLCQKQKLGDYVNSFYDAATELSKEFPETGDGGTEAVKVALDRLSNSVRDLRERMKKLNCLRNFTFKDWDSFFEKQAEEDKKGKFNEEKNYEEWKKETNGGILASYFDWLDETLERRRKRYQNEQEKLKYFDCEYGLSIAYPQITESSKDDDYVYKLAEKMNKFFWEKIADIPYATRLLILLSYPIDWDADEPDTIDRGGPGAEWYDSIKRWGGIHERMIECRKMIK